MEDADLKKSRQVEVAVYWRRLEMTAEDVQEVGRSHG